MNGFNLKFMKQFICLVLPHWLSLHTFHLYYKDIMAMLDGFNFQLRFILKSDESPQDMINHLQVSSHF